MLRCCVCLWCWWACDFGCGLAAFGFIGELLGWLRVFPFEALFWVCFVCVFMRCRWGLFYVVDA